MGVVFIYYVEGNHVYNCKICGTPIAIKQDIISGGFQGSTGKAYLFARAYNYTVSDVKDRLLITGRHFIRDVHCKKCVTKIGWMYEYAFETDQRYKEGNVIIERAYLVDSPNNQGNS